MWIIRQIYAGRATTICQPAVAMTPASLAGRTRWANDVAFSTIVRVILDVEALAVTRHLSIVTGAVSPDASSPLGTDNPAEATVVRIIQDIDARVVAEVLATAAITFPCDARGSLGATDSAAATVIRVVIRVDARSVRRGAVIRRVRADTVAGSTYLVRSARDAATTAVVQIVAPYVDTGALAAFLAEESVTTFASTFVTGWAFLARSRAWVAALSRVATKVAAFDASRRACRPTGPRWITDLTWPATGLITGIERTTKRARETAR